MLHVIQSTVTNLKGLVLYVSIFNFDFSLCIYNINEINIKKERKMTLIHNLGLVRNKAVTNKVVFVEMAKYKCGCGNIVEIRRSVGDGLIDCGSCKETILSKGKSEVDLVERNRTQVAIVNDDLEIIKVFRSLGATCRDMPISPTTLNRKLETGEKHKGLYYRYATEAELKEYNRKSK